MYFVIIGCGRMGSMMAKNLSNEGHDISIIDRDKNKLEDLGSGFNGYRIRGVEFDEDVLMRAGIEKADIFIALSPDDNINLTCCQIAKDIFKVPRIIARVNDPEKENLFNKFNIENICPAKVAVGIINDKVREEL